MAVSSLSPLAGRGRGEGEFNVRTRGESPHPDRHSASKTRVNALVAVRPLPASGER